MAVVSGIQCDWCGKTGKLEGNRSLPREPEGWRRITIMPRNGNEHDNVDLCPGCADAADKALGKAKKRRQTGKVQR